MNLNPLGSSGLNFSLGKFKLFFQPDKITTSLQSSNNTVSYQIGLLEREMPILEACYHKKEYEVNDVLCSSIRLQTSFASQPSIFKSNILIEDHTS
jgi:hypothetical protein